MDLNPHFEFQPSAQHSSSSYHQSSRRPVNGLDSHSRSQHSFDLLASTSTVASSRQPQGASCDDNNPYFEFQASTSSRPWAGSQRRASGGGSYGSSSKHRNSARQETRPGRSISPQASFHQRRPQASSAGGWEEVEKAAEGRRSSSTGRTESLSPGDGETALGAVILEGAKQGGPSSVCVLDT